MRIPKISTIILAGLVVVLGGGAVVYMMNISSATCACDVSVDTPNSEEELELQNLGVESIDASTVYSRFAVQNYSKDSKKGFYVFGDLLPGNRQNPNFEFASVAQDTKVIAAIDGVVAFIQEQAETKDYEVFLQTKENSEWVIGYDHLVDLAVKKGDIIRAGEVLGAPAMQNNGLYRFEFQVNRERAGTTSHICPVTLLNPEVADAVVADIEKTMTKWEGILSQGLYTQEAQEPMGCITSTLTPAEAEGR